MNWLKAVGSFFKAVLGSSKPVSVPVEGEFAPVASTAASFAADAVRVVLQRYLGVLPTAEALHVLKEVEDFVQLARQNLEDAEAARLP